MSSKIHFNATTIYHVPTMSEAFQAKKKKSVFKAGWELQALKMYEPDHLYSLHGSHGQLGDLKQVT